jgi:hypothetical protein
LHGFDNPLFGTAEESATSITPDAKIFQTFDRRVDRDVPIAISGLKYRARTARSTLPDLPEPFRH